MGSIRRNPGAGKCCRARGSRTRSWSPHFSRPGWQDRPRFPRDPLPPPSKNTENPTRKSRLTRLPLRKPERQHGAARRCTFLGLILPTALRPQSKFPPHGPVAALYLGPTPETQASLRRSHMGFGGAGAWECQSNLSPLSRGIAALSETTGVAAEDLRTRITDAVVCFQCWNRI